MECLKEIGSTRGYRRDDRMMRQTAGQSRNYYLQYYRADGGMKAAEEQQYSMIMAELFWLDGNSPMSDKLWDCLHRQMQGYEVYCTVVGSPYI